MVKKAWVVFQEGMSVFNDDTQVYGFQDEVEAALTRGGACNKKAALLEACLSTVKNQNLTKRKQTVHPSLGWKTLQLAL